MTSCAPRSSWEGLPHSVQVVERRATLLLNVVELDPRDGDVGQQLEARYDPRSHRIDVGRAPLMQVHAAHDAAGEKMRPCGCFLITWTSIIRRSSV